MSKHLMATGEIAARFGVTRQRAGQITAKRSFPKPYDVLTVGRVWRIRDVEAWIREHRPDLIPAKDLLAADRATRSASPKDD